MAANDNFTQPERGCLEKIRNIGNPLMNKLNGVLKEVIDLHAIALEEVFQEIADGKHKNGTVEYYQDIMKQKVGALSCKHN